MEANGVLVNCLGVRSKGESEKKASKENALVNQLKVYHRVTQLGNEGGRADGERCRSWSDFGDGKKLC